MIDSTNPRVMADNIRQLAAAGSGGSTVVPNPEGAATANLEKLGIDGSIYSIPTYTPPTYSTSEKVDTGEKWVNGKKIYAKVFVLDAVKTLSVNGAWTSMGISDDTIEDILDVKAYSGGISSLGVCFSGVGGVMNSGVINLINISTYDSLSVTTFVLKYTEKTVSANSTRKTAKK